MRRIAASLLTIFAAATQLYPTWKGPDFDYGIEGPQIGDPVLPVVQRVLENASYMSANLSRGYKDGEPIGAPVVAFVGNEEGVKYQAHISGKYMCGDHIEGTVRVTVRGSESLDVIVRRDTDASCWIGKNEVEHNGSIYPIKEGMAVGAGPRVNTILAYVLGNEKKILANARSADYPIMLGQVDDLPAHDHHDLDISDDILK